MKKLILLVFILGLSFASAKIDIPYTTDVITVVSEKTEFPITFFNDGDSYTFTASLRNNVPAAVIESNSLYIEKDSVGSFDIIIGDGDIENKVYFDSFFITKDGFVVQEIPLVIGKESSLKQYDLSIDFDPFLDLSTLPNGNIVVSSNFRVYKLYDDELSLNEVSLGFYVYSIDGKLLDYSEQPIYVGKESSFSLQSELQMGYPDEVLLVASVRSGDSLGLDFSQISLTNQQISLSPTVEAIDYSSKIYLSVFVFLLASIILISYLWYNKSVNQMNYWNNQIESLKNMTFTDNSEGLQKLYAQKNALQNAYSEKFISKNTFDSAYNELNALIAKLKKRL